MKKREEFRPGPSPHYLAAAVGRRQRFEASRGVERAGAVLDRRAVASGRNQLTPTLNTEAA